MAGTINFIRVHIQGLTTVSFDQTISVFEAATGRTIMKIPKAHKATISVIAHDPDNSRFITGGFDKRVKVWNNDGTIVYEISGFA